jgi:hypothetical protein
LKDHVEQRCVRDRTAVGDCDHARATPRMKFSMDAIVEQVRAVSSPARLDSTLENREDFVELFPSEISIRVGTPKNFEETFFLPWFSPTRSDNLLHKNIDRLWRDLESIKLTVSELSDKRCLFEQVIARHRKEPAFGE